MTSIPSGTQYEIRHGDQRAVLVEVGGGIHEYSVGGRPVLEGYGLEEVCDGARGAPLIPWPNRLADGRYRFAGVEHRLPLTEPVAHNAIHGLTRWRSWSPRVFGTDRVTLEHVLHPQPGYPFALLLAID